MPIKYFRDLNSFAALVNSSPESLLYPVGSEGGLVLDFFEYNNIITRILCIASPSVEGCAPQKFWHSTPVIPINFLPHFRETCTLIAAAPPDWHEQLNRMLTEFGFKEIFFFNAEELDQINKNIQRFVASGQAIMWSLNRIMRKQDRLEHLILEQPDIVSEHTKSFAEYRDRFRGRQVVIVGGGPTAKDYKPIPNAIHIGINFAWMRDDITFDFLFTQDRWQNELADVKMEDGFDRIHEKIFIGKSVDTFPRLSYPEYVSSKRSNVRRYYLDECPRPLDQIIHQDLCNHSIKCFGSTSFAALHFALHTAPEKIYLVGFDTASAGQHFYKHPDNRYDETAKNMQVGVMKVGYAKMKMFADEYYPDTELVSINPVGLKGLFTDMYTDRITDDMGGGQGKNNASMSAVCLPLEREAA